MKRKLIIKLSVCVVVSILVIVTLSVLSSHVTNSHGAFYRSIQSHAADRKFDLDLNVNSYYIAGATRNTIFLGNYTAPLYVMTIDRISHDTLLHKLDVEGIFDQKFWSVRVRVDSPDFYVYDGVVPRIFEGKTYDWRATRFSHDSEFFLEIEPIGSKSFVTRALLGENASLGKVSASPPSHFYKSSILKKQVDGAFCTDGYLHYNKELNRLVYLYRYRNEYILMDTSLNVLNVATTIDTNSVAKIEVATIRSSNTRVFQTDPLVVNQMSCLYGNYLFVNSALLSRNEPEDALKGAAVIDVYDLRSLTYRFSFYIFDYKAKEKLRGIKVSDDTMVALFDTHLQVFQLNRIYFPDL